MTRKGWKTVLVRQIGYDKLEIIRKINGLRSLGDAILFVLELLPPRSPRNPKGKDPKMKEKVM